MEKDIRWKQRFSNYKKAFKQLEEAVLLADTRNLTKLEKQGLIQSFEYTHELAWQVMKDFFFYQGNPEIRGSRDATREAFKNGLLDDGEIWMDMINSRNRSSHTYNEEIASEIAQKTTEQYFKAFRDFKAKMEEIGPDLP
ncbi:MAG: nucleotidyltransferase substrate binding protein [Cyclobacteriaceae bacterium]